MHLALRMRGWLLGRLGGRAQAEVVAILALVLSLEAADAGAIGGMAVQLQQSFGVGRAALGLLFSLESVVAAAGTIVFGWLIDRLARTRVLAIAVALWGVGMVACGAATSYTFLLVGEIALGAVIGAAQPAVASLVGDLFQPERRGRIYGSILSGELFGAAVGIVISGLLAGISWRLGFWVLALPTPFLAWAIHRLPEPARGGASFLAEGQERIEVRPPGEAHPSASASLGDRARESGVAARDRLVQDVDPGRRSLLWAVGYVLKIPTNLLLIVVSALGYYFFADLRIFTIEFLGGHYHLSHEAAIGVGAVAGSGAIFGVYAGGKLADVLLARGHLRARVWVASCAYLASAVLYLVGLLSPAFALSLIMYFLAAFALGAVNPPLDAARLDIMHAHLWGRAEGIRTTLRKVAEAVAPVLFGYVADDVLGGGAEGLREAFLVMLIPLGVGGLVGLIALRTYLRDAASAAAFMERTGGSGGSPGGGRAAGAP